MNIENKLTPNDAISLMLHHINTDNKANFYKVAEDYCNTFASGSSVGNKIKIVLNNRPRQLTSLSDLSGDLKKLITQRDYKDENVFLDNRTQLLVDSLLSEWKHKEIYKYHNIPVRSKILLHGPTGNGKTTIARHIARISNMPFVEVNADMMIDSKLGQSNANIYKILNEIKAECVLFWDEVDTIGRSRGRGDNSSASLENERIINSLLVNIEKLSSDVIFIGATNRLEVMDSAFLRRFDTVFEISTPDLVEKERFAKQLISYYNLPEESFSIDVGNLNNHSEVKLEILSIARKFVLDKINNYG